MTPDGGTAVLLVGHGSSSYPASAGCLARHAETIRKVGKYVAVEHATLTGGPDPVDALKGMSDAARIVVLPMFMSDGFLTGLAVTSRLGEFEKDPRLIICRPLGLTEDLVSLIAQTEDEISRRNGWVSGAWDLFLVAHGSQKDPASRNATQWVHGRMATLSSADHIHIGYIEEEPFAHDIAQSLKRPTIVIGLFAAPGGHALADVPAALARANVRVDYGGPIGAHPNIADAALSILEAATQSQIELT